ncbi:protein DMR6-LIKE OXYGENASE 2 isoform X2 [Eucalyptus grandis]|uniref:protein DMR6-LIKE OXYGENASE 2 isoform X2 n=1 Tax=Eucalyptus grandis TaxID=71139 RepID=UPI00192EE8E0|nr:protein DMR6-LIKE OXYGENASE 2 isoform X2 [Eucalyptus grandis]
MTPSPSSTSLSSPQVIPINGIKSSRILQRLVKTGASSWYICSHPVHQLISCFIVLFFIRSGRGDPKQTVINHGVPEGQMKAMVDMLMGFFDLTEEEKREFEGKHVLDGIRWGTSFNTSVDKVFFWRDYLKVRVHPEFHCPSKPEGFSEVLAEYAGAVRKLARGLLKGISESLGLEPGYIDEAMNMDSSLQRLTANLYPPCPQPELAMGMPPHSDHGLLTILMQNGIGGLQVHHGGKWVKIDPIPNAFLVNTGDHLEIMSNGKYKSVLHRAVVNNKDTRISIILSNGPSLDTVVTPAEQLVDGESNRAMYIGMKYKDFLELHQSSVLDGKSGLERVKI